MNNEFLNTFYQISEEVNAELKHHLSDKIREQDTYGITKELITFLATYENENISMISILCNPSLVNYLESNNLYYKKIKDALPFHLELKGDPTIESRSKDDHHVFVAGSVEYKT